jgi:hypothetical protein
MMRSRRPDIAPAEGAGEAIAASVLSGLRKIRHRPQAAAFGISVPTLRSGGSCPWNGRNGNCGQGPEFLPTLNADLKSAAQQCFLML